MSGPEPQKILLIDDETMLHELARAHLQKAGYQLLSAYDGASGLALILQEQPVLVLLDFVLPDRDGEQIFHELSTNVLYEAVRKTPVIMLTGHGADEALKKKMIAAGVSEAAVTPPSHHLRVQAQRRGIGSMPLPR